MRTFAIFNDCSHFHAEQTGTTEASQLRDGRWRYSASYVCPVCGAHFTEVNTQELPTPDELIAEVGRLGSAISEPRMVRERLEDIKRRIIALEERRGEAQGKL